jgi:uncharacterized protein (DUF2141 family)
MKKFLAIVFVLCGISSMYADITFTLEVHNVKVNQGTVFLGVYFNQESFSNESPDVVVYVDATAAVISQEITLPQEGEYLIGLHQDLNGNGIMDYGVFGIPKEPYAFSNMKGKIPSKKFDKAKVRIEDNAKVVISLVEF